MRHRRPYDHSDPRDNPFVLPAYTPDEERRRGTLGLVFVLAILGLASLLFRS
jgi:hypothetical protein